jgi:hypothetical protein
VKFTQNARALRGRARADLEMGPFSGWHAQCVPLSYKFMRPVCSKIGAISGGRQIDHWANFCLGLQLGNAL